VKRTAGWSRDGSPARTVGDVERQPLPVDQQAASFYSDLSRRPAQMIRRLLFDHVNELLPVGDHAEYGVLAVQARRRPGGDEKLTSVRIGGACHRGIRFA